MKIPFFYSAYDNGYKYPMGICITLGGSALLSGIFGGDTELIIGGIIGIVLFFVFKYLNYACAKKREEERLKASLSYFNREVDEVINDKELTNIEKIHKIVKLAKEGNVVAMAFLEKLREQNR